MPPSSPPVMLHSTWRSTRSILASDYGKRSIIPSFVGNRCSYPPNGSLSAAPCAHGQQHHGKRSSSSLSPCHNYFHRPMKISPSASHPVNRAFASSTPSSRLTNHVSLTEAAASRTFSSSSNSSGFTNDDDDDDEDINAILSGQSLSSPSSSSSLPTKRGSRRGQRVWRAKQRSEKSFVGTEIMESGDDDTRDVRSSSDVGSVTVNERLAVDTHGWDAAVDEIRDRRLVDDSLARICAQEREGGRMKQSQLGVLREDPHDDMRLMLENYTVAALASALRDREDALQLCATLLSENRLDELSKILRPYEQQYILQRRHTKERLLRFRNGVGFDARAIELLRKGLNRMPRRVSQAHSKRAGVVLPLCNVDGVPCILFEKRSRHLRAHPDEVCLPGGMVSEGGDKSIVETCLREMEEEIGISRNSVTVLGVLRCNWGEVHHLVGVAVTPVVCFLGEIGKYQLHPNPNEVAECFTVPLQSFLDRDRWVHKKQYAPFFTGGPHIIWGLTGYIVNRLVMDIIEPFDVVFEGE